MESCKTCVSFSLSGDDFDPRIISERINIEPTKLWRKGDKGQFNPVLKYSRWILSTDKGVEYIDIDKLVDEIVTKLANKIEIINKLKVDFDLHSTLEIELWIDENHDVSTPALGHDLKTIDFLYKTQTETDVDIFRFNSSK